MSPKTVVVFTATGAQGGSVARYIREAGWTVIGVTRNPDSDSAKALKEIGVQVVQGDLNDPSTYKVYFKGADATFINANFWETFFSNGFNGPAAAATETKQNKDAIQAAHDAGVPHIVFSTLDDTHGVTVHSDSKAVVTNWAKENNILITNFYQSFYWNNIIRFQAIQPNPDGTFTITLEMPDHCQIVGNAPEQTGAWIKAVLEHPEEWKGKELHGAAERISIADMAKVFSEISGKEVKSLGMSDEEFYSPELKEKIGEGKWGNWKLFMDGLPKRDIEQSRRVAPEAWSFKEWAQQSAELKEILKF